MLNYHQTALRLRKQKKNLFTCNFFTIHKVIYIFSFTTLAASFYQSIKKVMYNYHETRSAFYTSYWYALYCHFFVKTFKYNCYIFKIINVECFLKLLKNSDYDKTLYLNNYHRMTSKSILQIKNSNCWVSQKKFES